MSNTRTPRNARARARGASPPAPTRARSAVLLGAMLAVGLIQSGCATLLSGTDQQVLVTSEPQGARVEVVGDDRPYTTPARLTLPRKNKHVLLVGLDGHHTERVELRQRMNPAVLGNIVFWVAAPIGIGADIASGAAANLRPESIHINLEPAEAGQQPLIRPWSPPGDE